MECWRPGWKLDDIEYLVIYLALIHHKGNKVHTARALGISIRKLRALTNGKKPS
jgi:DNA-binding NtrC family response regulator